MIVSSVTLPEVVEKYPLGPEAFPPIAFAQIGELHLQTARASPLDLLHDVGKEQFWWNIDKHVDLIAREHSAHNMNAQVIASLADDRAQALAQRSLQDLVAITMMERKFLGCGDNLARKIHVGLADVVQAVELT